MPASQHKPPEASDSIYFALNGEITAVRRTFRTLFRTSEAILGKPPVA